MLNEAKTFRTLDQDFAHGAGYEKTRGSANGEVFLNDARILNGHVPPAKLGHPGAQFLVQGMKSSFSQADGGRIHHALENEGIKPTKSSAKTSIRTQGCQTGDA